MIIMVNIYFIILGVSGVMGKQKLLSMVDRSVSQYSYFGKEYNNIYEMKGGCKL